MNELCLGIFIGVVFSGLIALCGYLIGMWNAIIEEKKLEEKKNE